MDSPLKKPSTTVSSETNRSGLYARGVVISNRAFAFQRKDGSGTVVKVQCEIALQPGVAVWERYFDPSSDTAVKVDGEEVTAFPTLREFSPVEIRVDRFRLDGDHLVIKSGTPVGE